MKITKKETDVLVIKDVEVRTATVGDLIQAERAAGKAEGIAFIAALLAQIATFDGKKLPPEDLYKLSVADMTELGNVVAPSLADGVKQP